MCLGKRVPFAQLASVSSIDVAVTCNKQAAPVATGCLKMEDVQAKLATLVNETLLGLFPAGTALPAGCLLLVSIPDTQLGTFGPGDLTEACFGKIPNENAFACVLDPMSDRKRLGNCALCAGKLLGSVAVQWDAADTVRCLKVWFLCLRATKRMSCCRPIARFHCVGVHTTRRF